MKIKVDDKVIIELSKTDIIVLKDGILCIEDMIKHAVVGKVNNCKKRMINEWQQRLFSDPLVTSIPATADELIAVIVTRDDYKDRVARDLLLNLPE